MVMHPVILISVMGLRESILLVTYCLAIGRVREYLRVITDTIADPVLEFGSRIAVVLSLVDNDPGLLTFFI